MKAVRLYAQVLSEVLSSSSSKVSIDLVMEELRKFESLLVQSPLMTKVFDNPVLGEDDKLSSLRAFVQKLDLSQTSEKFLSMLIKRNRLSILPQVLNEVESIQIQKAGGLTGELVSALPLDPGTVSTIAQVISKKMNKSVRLKEKVDPSVIAGLRVTVGGKTFDGTVRTKLNKIKDSFQ